MEASKSSHHVKVQSACDGLIVFPERAANIRSLSFVAEHGRMTDSNLLGVGRTPVLCVIRYWVAHIAKRK